jgi:hypothetical protein
MVWGGSHRSAGVAGITSGSLPRTIHLRSSRRVDNSAPWTTADHNSSSSPNCTPKLRYNHHNFKSAYRPPSPVNKVRRRLTSHVYAFPPSTKASRQIWDATGKPIQPKQGNTVIDATIPSAFVYKNPASHVHYPPPSAMHKPYLSPIRPEYNELSAQAVKLVSPRHHPERDNDRNFSLSSESNNSTVAVGLPEKSQKSQYGAVSGCGRNKHRGQLALNPRFVAGRPIDRMLFM